MFNQFIGDEGWLVLHEEKCGGKQPRKPVNYYRRGMPKAVYNANQTDEFPLTHECAECGSKDDDLIMYGCIYCASLLVRTTISGRKVRYVWLNTEI